MIDDELLEAHDSLRDAATADKRWHVVKSLFSQNGVDYVTAGTAPRTRLDTVTVRTSVPEGLMSDYIAEKLYLDDPWIVHSATSAELDEVDFEQAPVSALTNRCERLLSVFADHGFRRVCLVPTYNGLRPGALVLYSSGKDQTAALRDRRHLVRLRNLSAVVAAYWRPEYSADLSTTSNAQAYSWNPVLSAREHETLRWLANGLHSEEIAHKMGVKTVTVTKHMASARRKLGARTREQALAIAIRDGFIVP